MNSAAASLTFSSLSHNKAGIVEPWSSFNKSCLLLSCQKNKRKIVSTEIFNLISRVAVLTAFATTSLSLSSTISKNRVVKRSRKFCIISIISSSSMSKSSVMASKTVDRTPASYGKTFWWIPSIRMSLTSSFKHQPMYFKKSSLTK